MEHHEANIRVREHDPPPPSMDILQLISQWRTQKLYKQNRAIITEYLGEQLIITNLREGNRTWNLHNKQHD
jgi:hypothetical protein